jgi:hypothetical protein
MRHFRMHLILAVALAATSASAYSQYRDRYGNLRYGSYKGTQLRGPDLVSRVLSDLDRMRSYRFVDRHERGHFEDARRDLLRFQESWIRGRFDRGRLDSAIENLRHLANSDQVHPRERQLLARDLSVLRSFRARPGAYRGSYRY